jgi:hypothetical protein
MHANPFTLPFDRLPVSLPIFPLPGTIVMPGAPLPLNIFEPRYLNMIVDALAEDRMIGMVQPDPAAKDPRGEAIYRTGTAGRITAFNETRDGRFLIRLTGICRFDIQEEVPTVRGTGAWWPTGAASPSITRRAAGCPSAGTCWTA